MSLFLLNILLAIAWAALTGSFQPLDLLFGFLLGYLVLWLGTRMGTPPQYFRKISLVLGLLGVFLLDLLRANIRMAILILSPRMKLRPAVVAVPLVLKSKSAIVLLINLITLTPGTLSLDITTDQSVMFVHTVYLEDPEQFKQQLLTGYEKRLQELFEG
jgi:multicomponent Na+:H+ antiporter subunit E